MVLRRRVDNDISSGDHRRSGAERRAADPHEARDALTTPIDRIRFLPGAEGGEWSIELIGDLAAPLELGRGAASEKPMVAGA